MCKQGAYEAGRRRQKEENYKEKLYRRLKQQWIGPYKPFDVDDDWYEYDEQVPLPDHYDIDGEKDYCWRLHHNDFPTSKLWYRGECRYPKMQPKSYYDYDELDWEEDEVWYVSFKVVVEVHPDCDYSLSNLVEEEEEEHFNYDSGLKQGCERNQSRRIKEYNYKQRLDRRFKHLIDYNPYQHVGHYSHNPDLLGDDGTFLSKGSRHREELTRDERQAKYLRCYGFEKGWSDRKQIVAEKVALLEFKQQVDELFSFDYEEMYYNPDDDLMLGCDALDVEWIKRTYGYDLDDELRKWQEEEEFDESLKVLLDDFSAEDY